MKNTEKLFIVKVASGIARRAVRYPVGNYPYPNPASWKKTLQGRRLSESEADDMFRSSSGSRPYPREMPPAVSATSPTGGFKPTSNANSKTKAKSLDHPIHGDKRPRDMPKEKPSIESLGGYDSLRELVERAIRTGHINKESPVSALMKL